jgi:hypothetical protein
VSAAVSRASIRSTSGEPTSPANLVPGVPPKGKVGHGKVVGDEVLHDLDFVVGHLEPGRRLPRDSCPHDAVVPDVPLPKIVQEQREQQRTAAADLLPDFPEPSRAAIERRRLLDRVDAVLVHGELVVVVELHQAGGVAKGGDDPLEYAELVEVAKGGRETQRMVEEREEPRPGGGVKGELLRMHDTTNRLERRRINVTIEEHGQLEQPQDRGEARRHAGNAGGGHRHGEPREPKRIVDTMAEATGHATQDGRGHLAAAFHRPGDPRDLAGVGEILPHEPLDAEQPALLTDATGLRDRKLLVPPQVVLGTPGGQVHLEPQPHEKIGSPTQDVGVGPRERTDHDEVVERPLVVTDGAEPSHQLHVA